MDFFELTDLQPIFNAFGWTLLHFLWQGMLVALLVRAALILLQRRAPNIRYLTMCAALCLMLLFPVLTFGLLYDGREHSANVDEARLVQSESSFVGKNEPLENAQISQISNENKTAKQESGAALTGEFEKWFPWIILLWFAGVLTLSARFFIDWLTVQKLRVTTTRRLKEWQPIVTELARQLGINKSIQFLESSLVKVPVAAGWLKPVILLPVGMAINLTPAQLESIIAHELAHIRRHDYLVNIFQTFAEILLFYHPAVLWLSKQIRIEREYACDDLAVAACGGDPIGYARALTKVERLRQTVPLPATAANGGSLETRVRRLVDASYREHSAGGFSAGLVFLLTLAVAGFGLQSVADRGKTPEPTPRNAVILLPDNTESSEPQNQLTTTKNSDLNAESFSGEDARARKIALDALGEHLGSVIIMNPKTGRLLTIVNQELAFRREWNPASTFKLVTSIAALNENKISADEKIVVSEKGEKLNLNDALAVSRNEYFEILGNRVGTKKLLATARQFGLGSPTGVNLPGEVGGYLPATDFGLNAGEVGIYGQEVKATPLQLAVMIATFANRGTPVRPFAGEPENVPQFLPALNASPDSISQIVAGMRSAVEKGTGKGAFNRSFAVAGKTGTARAGEDDIGLFASFAPLENPQFVVVVAIREPAANGRRAGEIAGKIYDALDKNRLVE